MLSGFSVKTPPYVWYCEIQHHISFLSLLPYNKGYKLSGLRVMEDINSKLRDQQGHTLLVLASDA